MATRQRKRIVIFDVVDGALTRKVIFPDGRSYTHRCVKQVFETVAHAINETPAQGEGTTLERIAQREDLPFSQVNVALEFMKERGVVEVRHRCCYPASTCAFEDAMMQFCYLADAPY